MSSLVKRRRVLASVAIALVLFCTVWFAIPTQALVLTVDSLPSTVATTGTTTFYVTAEAYNYESVRANSFRIDIAGGTQTHYAVFSPDGTITSQSGVFSSITQTVAPDRYGYGYGYNVGTQYSGSTPTYSYGYSWGYGYGYGYASGPSAYGTLFRFQIVITNSSLLPSTSYTAQFKANVGNSPGRYDSAPVTFQTAAAAPSSAPFVPAPGTVTVTPALTGFAPASPLLIAPDGVVQQAFSATSTDGRTQLQINVGTKATLNGQPIASITAAPVASPPAPPAGSNIVGIAYEFGPSGSQFDPPITIAVQVSAADIAGMDINNLTLAYYDGSQWVRVPSYYNASTGTIVASVSHFTTFAVMDLPPAVSTTPTTPPVKPTPPVEPKPTTPSTPKPAEPGKITIVPTPSASTPTATTAASNWYMIGGVIGFAIVVAILLMVGIRRREF